MAAVSNGWLEVLALGGILALVRGNGVRLCWEQPDQGYPDRRCAKGGTGSLAGLTARGVFVATLPNRRDSLRGLTCLYPLDTAAMVRRDKTGLE